MIDLITLVKPMLSEEEITTIVEANHLQINSKNGVIYYDNISTKNLTQQKGVFIRIETNRKLKVECSLHKYYNEICGMERNNYNPFSMSDARRSIDSLLIDKSILTENLRVYNYEIGLNMNVSKDCRNYLDKMKSIGPAGQERPLYVNPIHVNPIHRNERAKVTGCQKVRKYFKVYDKVYECLEKNRKVIPEGNILRIETVYKRLENCPVIDFFQPANLGRMIEMFFRDWRTVQFEKDIITPKGTGRAKQHVCVDIINKGRDVVLKQAKERHANGSLSDWEYRNTREFIMYEWDDIKKRISFIQSDEEKEFRELLKVNHTLLKNDDFIN